MTDQPLDARAHAGDGDQAAREAKAAPDKLVVARPPVAFGIIPSGLDEAYRMAKYFTATDLVPADYRNKPEAALTCMQYGAELGLAPMTALQSIAVINGRPTLWGDALLAVIQASALYEDHAEYFDVGGVRREFLTDDDLTHDTTAAVCAFWRAGMRQPTIGRFSIAQAKRANLWGKAGPWRQYPDRMLKMRARSWTARDTFADLLKGLRAAEELIDVDPIEKDDPPPRRVPRLSDPPAADDLHAFVDRTAATRLADAPKDDGQ